MPKSPLVSIVVITLNTPRLTRACLASVVRNTSVPYELIVVNNSQAGAIRKTIRSFPQIRLIQNKKNLGFAKAANQGSLAAQGRYVCFLNSDALVPPGWLKRLLEAVQRPGVGAAGPLSQHIHRFKCNWPPAQLPANETTTSLADEVFQHWGQGRLESSHFLYGFCLLIPKVVMARVGLFDEDFFFGVEDIDYSLRLRLAGYQLLLVRSLFVHHHRSGSVVAKKRRQLVDDSERHFVTKWSSPLQGEGASDYTLLLRKINSQVPFRKTIPKKSQSAKNNLPKKPQHTLPRMLRSGFTLKTLRGSVLVRLSDLEVFVPNKLGQRVWNALERSPYQLRLNGHHTQSEYRKSLKALESSQLVTPIQTTSPTKVLVTVMMIAHNAESWIAEAIESVLSQQFKQFELVVLDDDSTDQTAQIIQQYLWHPQVRFLQNSHQTGVAISRNRVLANARGKYIAICDSDDVMLPTHLKNLVRVMEKDDKLGWVYADRLKILDSGLPELQSQPARGLDGKTEWKRNIIDHAGALIRKQAIEEVGGYDETLLNASDYDLGLKIAQRYQVKALPGQVHYLWRRHPTSISTISPWRKPDTDRLLKRAKQQLVH